MDSIRDWFVVETLPLKKVDNSQVSSEISQASGAQQSIYGHLKFRDIVTQGKPNVI